MDFSANNENASVPGTSKKEDEVITVDVSSDVLVDSVTELPPDLTMSTEGNEENGEDTTRLTLAYERLYEIPRTIVERFAEHVRHLDISHNKITASRPYKKNCIQKCDELKWNIWDFSCMRIDSINDSENLDPLVYFRHLTSLIADDNPITDTCVLPPLPKLQLLWVNYCKIGSLYPWVAKLKESCPNLQYLCLMGNPAAPSYLNGGNFYDYLQYRLFVISQFPSLNHLDDRKVTEDQKAEAQRLYKRPFFERIVRPSSGGIYQLMHTPVTWSNFQNKISSLWGNKQERNLLI